MTVKAHEEWLVKMRVGRAGPKSLPALQALAREVKRALKTSITVWHQEQVEGVIAQLLAEGGDTASSARAFRAIARRSHEWLMYYLESSRFSLETAAALYERAGKKSTAARLRREAAALVAFHVSRARALKKGGKRGA
jgi:hypothetical protein